eukprot:TRINITY_DN13007_c0_g1_i1.p1 TRINITY_DN13007_c0_g1~~TRINITY_DN13007_c0_g1_i1.p1  ORF type:complete len:125 (-),score=5.23 TRINITY_DN13007_c0_g1_i1:12-386(-)
MNESMYACPHGHTLKLVCFSANRGCPQRTYPEKKMRRSFPKPLLTPRETAQCFHKRLHTNPLQSPNMQDLTETEVPRWKTGYTGCPPKHQQHLWFHTWHTQGCKLCIDLVLRQIGFLRLDHMQL